MVNHFIAKHFASGDPDSSKMSVNFRKRGLLSPLGRPLTPAPPGVSMRPATARDLDVLARVDEGETHAGLAHRIVLPVSHTCYGQAGLSRGRHLYVAVRDGLLVSKADRHSERIHFLLKKILVSSPLSLGWDTVVSAEPDLFSCFP